MPRRIRVFPIPLFLAVIPIVLPHPRPLVAQPSLAADSLYEAGEFAAAAEAYAALSRAHPDSGRVWLSKRRGFPTRSWSRPRRSSRSGE